MDADISRIEYEPYYIKDDMGWDLMSELMSPTFKGVGKYPTSISW